MDILSDIKKAFLKLSFQNKYCLILLTAMVCYLPLMQGYVNSHDEIWTILVTQLPFKEMMNTIITDDGNPPLFYLYERLWNIDGEQLNVFWARCANLSILFLTSLLGLFPIRRLFGDTVALLFCVLIFAMPPTFVLSTNIRGYALSGFLLCGVFVYSLCLAYNKKTSDWFWLILFSALCPYNHYLCGLWELLIWTALAAAMIIKKNWTDIAKLFGCGVAVCLLYAPWLIVFIRQYGSMKNFWYPSMYYVEKTSLGFLLNFESYSFWALAAGAFCWSLIFQTASDRKRKALDSVAIWHFLFVNLSFYFITMMICIFARPMMTNRYLLPFLPMFYLSTALALKHFSKFAKILLLFLLPAIFVAYNNARDLSGDKTFGNLREYVTANAGAKSLIVTDDSTGHLIAEYYLSEYDNILALKKPEIILFQQKTIKDMAKSTNLEQYDSIFSISGIIQDCDKTFKPVLQNGICIKKLSAQNAREMIEKSQKIIEYSYH